MSTNGRGVAVAIGIVGVFVGIAFGFMLDRGGSEVSAPSETSTTAGPGPFDETNGVPTGYSRTEVGAVAAAANFSLITSRSDLRSADALASALQTVAAPEWQEEAAKQATAGREFIVQRYGEGAELASAPLRYEVVQFSPQSAQINLWTVSVAAGPTAPTVQELWGTLTVELAWIDGDWRVTGNSSVAGPTPVDIPSADSVGSANDVMENFDEFNRAPIP